MVKIGKSKAENVALRRLPSLDALNTAIVAARNRATIAVSRRARLSAAAQAADVAVEAIVKATRRRRSDRRHYALLELKWASRASRLLPSRRPISMPELAARSAAVSRPMARGDVRGGK